MISVYYPEKAEPKDIKAIIGLWDSMSILYPCQECRDELMTFLRYIFKLVVLLKSI